MRSDAHSNRLRILEAAMEVFATPGDTSLKRIAHRAGVGKGTLYRHFPTRESLVLQVYAEEVEGLEAAVRVLLDALSPLLALRAWLERLLKLGRCLPEFAAALHPPTGMSPGGCGDPRRPLLDALAALVSANESAGTITPGTTAEDVLLLLGPLWHVGGADEDGARAQRLFETLLRGLCPSGSARECLVTGA
ncbi:TetR/AcrR family transcriptional regulator [Streptomyces sp. E5N91]|uniref:TetR/AcrR family transcriptional regulator n=1 Tax=Streptomyces sp. E5N91 TaxID=1851996 RepID=UPI000EF60E80|nr:TetR/AcrR family transcriptional regulator [Streptomyces sp. E5N91]